MRQLRQESGDDRPVQPLDLPLAVRAVRRRPCHCYAEGEGERVPRLAWKAPPAAGAGPGGTWAQRRAVQGRWLLLAGSRDLISSLKEHRSDVVAGDVGIGGDDCEPEVTCLRYQDPIEWIAVKHW